MAQPETHRPIQRDRLGADLLSAKPLCTDLLGEVALLPPPAARHDRR